jgi:hypothetical protein
MSLITWTRTALFDQTTRIPHGGLIAACEDAPMARVVWTVREGKPGSDAPELVSGYRSSHPVHEPKLGDVLFLPDGSGPWRVVDWLLADRLTSEDNVLVVERVAD